MWSSKAVLLTEEFETLYFSRMFLRACLSIFLLIPLLFYETGLALQHPFNIRNRTSERDLAFVPRQVCAAQARKPFQINRALCLRNSWLLVRQNAGHYERITELGC